MAETKKGDVTMRVRVGDNEVEVTGPKDFVEKKVQDFLDQYKQIGPAPRGPSGEGAPAVAPASTGRAKKMSVAQFFRKGSAKTDVGRVLAAGYYLENYGRQESFTTAEVARTIRLAKANPPKNPSEGMAKNIRKGLIMPSGDKEGKRAYVLTTDGEEAIQELLNA